MLMTINLSAEIIALGATVFTSIVTAVFAAGRFHQKIKTQESNIAKIETTVDKLTTEVRVVSSKLDQLIGKVSVILKDTISETLSASESPRRLNELGKKVLKDSSIEQVLEPLFDEIVEKVRQKNPENPYQAQEGLFEAVQAYRTEDGLRSAIENGAYLSGHTPEEVLFVGALNMRDKVIEALGLEVGDIDKHDPKKNGKSKKNS